MKVTETIDSSLTMHQNNYTIAEPKKIYRLKTIHIPKNEPFKYAFLGGMWYSKDKFSFTDEQLSIPYPFTTYYTLKILDETVNQNLCRSALYLKMPVCIVQFSNQCILIEFDPYININNQDVFPFIQLNETEKSYDISFYLFTSYRIKHKEHAWLGKGKKSTINVTLHQNDTFLFNTKISTCSTWQEAILTKLKKYLNTEKKEPVTHDPEKIFFQAKKALWRSYDHKRGTFLQLPWRETPGFTFVNSSYSLPSYEAVRLDYFSQWYQQTKDEDFATWMKQLQNLFVQPEMHTYPTKQGKGIIWYNMTTLTKKGLAGYFYMDTGYSGYPGGQATIDLHLLNYLFNHADKKLQDLVKQSLHYILSTQNNDGSWPMAIRQQGKLKFRPENLQDYVTSGGTAESVRALLKGAAFYDDDTMKDAAHKGLQFLRDNYPICYHGLRDIGVMEPEAFSAVSIINAFLDSYENSYNEEDLQSANLYALYTVPWIYQWETNHLSFSFDFHPISYSITPRLSPYETAWIISTYHRLSTHTKESFWEKINTALFNHVTNWISETGGLSEGIFPSYFSGFKRLPMEQTFATVELMKSAEIMMKKHCLTPKKTKNHPQRLKKSFQLNKNDSTLMLTKDNTLLFCFDNSKAAITHINDASLNEMGISFSFYGGHTKKLRRKIKKHFRGNYGKFLLGAKDALYAFTGVKGPKPIRNIHLELLQKQVLNSTISIVSPRKANICYETAIHRITIQFLFSSRENNLNIEMNVTVEVKIHDLSVKQQIVFPVIGAKPVRISKEAIEFDRFILQTNADNIIKKDSYTAIDQTYSTNWTHAGLCKKTFNFVLPLN